MELDSNYVPLKFIEKPKGLIIPLEVQEGLVSSKVAPPNLHMDSILKVDLKAEMICHL